MVMDPPQQPIVRDFLGLGKLVTDHHEEPADVNASAMPSFLSTQGLLRPPTDVDLRGAKNPLCNIGLSMECNFPSKKASEEVFVEGSAESYGMANPRQWRGMVPGTNITTGEPPARLLASDAYAKSNGMQLTICYGGHVNVYNNIQADKAQALMDLAGNSNFLSLNPHGLGAEAFCQRTGVAENFCFNPQTGPIQFTADQASQNYPAANKQFEGPMPDTPTSASSPQPVVPRALPLARKASLARFLEKRKERMQMMMPYIKKQFSSAQGSSTGDQKMVGPFQGATLAKLYEEYYRRPSSMVFVMPEAMLPHNDMPSGGIPAKE